jgi:mannose-6-phosphate isomerase-like protein (cupin superfamily)
MNTTQPLSPATTRFDGSTGPRIIGPRDGKFVDLRSVGVRFMIWGEESGGGFSLVEHPIPPRTLVAPLHLHEREDEYSYVLEGRMGAQLGDDVVYAEAGDLVFKPRNQWHTFWNAGDTPCRILEIISPAGFEHFFEELGERSPRRTRPAWRRCPTSPGSRPATATTSSRRASPGSAGSTACGSLERRERESGRRRPRAQASAVEPGPRRPLR